MARLVDFRKKAQRKVYVSLVDTRIYVAIATTKDLFEPRLFRTMVNFNPIREYFEDLQLMLSIVDELNLNQRIWMQQ
jgi:hypothetical protein